MNNIPFLLKYYLDNTNELLPFILFTFITIMISTYCFTNNEKVINEITEENNESVVSDSSSSCPEIDDTMSDSSEDQYTSILYKSFLLMTKKQLLRIAGIKYKNVNKDELIILAMNKFILLSIENFKLIPIDTKMYIENNKNIMKEELFKLYNVKTKNEKEYSKDIKYEEEYEMETEIESDSD
jgi:hypothetical protein